MKISWHRQLTTQLRMPPVCAATGAPAGKKMLIVFRNRYSYYLPGIGRTIMNLVHRFVVLAVPLSDEVGKKVLTLRLISLASIFAGIGIAITLAVGVGDAAGAGLFLLFLVGGLVASVVTGRLADVVGTDVSSDVISMRTAHPVFVRAVVALNPPGVFQVEGDPRGPSDGEPPYPQQPQYGQPQYPQQPYGLAR